MSSPNIVQLNQTIEIVIDDTITEQVHMDGKTTMSQLLLSWEVGEERVLNLGIGVGRKVRVARIL